MHRKRRPTDVVVSSEIHPDHNRTTASIHTDSANISTTPSYGSVDTLANAISVAVATTTAETSSSLSEDNSSTLSTNVHSNHNINAPSTSASCQNLIA